MALLVVFVVPRVASRGSASYYYKNQHRAYYTELINIELARARAENKHVKHRQKQPERTIILRDQTFYY